MCRDDRPVVSIDCLQSGMQPAAWSTDNATFQLSKYLIITLVRASSVPSAPWKPNSKSEFQTKQSGRNVYVNIWWFVAVEMVRNAFQRQF